MHRKILVPLILLGFTCGSHALTDEGKRAAEELISALREETKVPEGSNSENNRGYSAKQFIGQLLSAIAKGNDSYIEQALEASGNYLNGEKTIASLAKFREALKAGREQQAQAYIERLEGQIKITSEKILAARIPSDLDGLIDDLSKNQSSEYDDRYGSDAARQRTIHQLINRLTYAKQFATGWQNYLQAKKIGNSSQAIQSLQSIVGSDSSIMPRSEILDRIELEKKSTADASKIAEGIGTLEDMQGAIKALNAAQINARNGEQNTQSITDLLQGLLRLEKSYREFVAGLSFNIEVSSQNYDSTSNTTNTKIIQLRADLLKLLIPRYLNLPEGTAAKPGESIPQFMDRLLTDSKQRKDYAASKRIVELQTNLRSNRIASQDTVGLKEYSAGQNQLAAGQLLPAVISLQRALASGSDLLPTERIGEQLAAIKKDHPKEYEQGMAEYLTPRPSSEYPGMPFRGYDPRGYDPRQQAAPSVLLPIPAKESAAPPKAEAPKPAEEPAKPAEAPVKRESPPPAR